MDIISSAFLPNQNIPEKYTCDGENKSPPLTFSKISKQARYLNLIVEDQDAPSKPNFTHWVVFNIPSATLTTKAGDVPRGGKEGLNDFGDIGYSGPCPPEGMHHYFFRLYATAEPLNLTVGATKEDVLGALEGKILDSAVCIGRYERLKGGE